MSMQSQALTVTVSVGLKNARMVIITHIKNNSLLKTSSTCDLLLFHYNILTIHYNELY